MKEKVNRIYSCTILFLVLVVVMVLLGILSCRHAEVSEDERKRSGKSNNMTASH